MDSILVCNLLNQKVGKITRINTAEMLSLYAN